MKQSMIRRGFLGARSAAALGALVCVATATLGGQQVTFERILRPDREPQNWLSYSGNCRQSSAQPADRDHARQREDLELKWVWQAGRWRNSKRRRSSWTACCTRCRVRRFRAGTRSSRSTR